MAARAGECRPRRTRGLAMPPARKRGPGRAKLQGDRNAGRPKGDAEHPGGALSGHVDGRAVFVVVVEDVHRVRVEPHVFVGGEAAAADEGACDGQVTGADPDRAGRSASTPMGPGRS
jgi:hypothetical protein